MTVNFKKFDSKDNVELFHVEITHIHDNLKYMVSLEKECKMLFENGYYTKLFQRQYEIEQLRIDTLSTLEDILYNIGEWL